MKPKRTCEEELALAKKLSSPEGFLEEYQSRLYDYTRNIDAYYSVEDDFMRIFGRTRYSCYQSFHTIMRRLIKSRTK